MVFMYQKYGVYVSKVWCLGAKSMVIRYKRNAISRIYGNYTQQASFWNITTGRFTPATYI